MRRLTLIPLLLLLAVVPWAGGCDSAGDDAGSKEKFAPTMGGPAISTDAPPFATTTHPHPPVPGHWDDLALANGATTGSWQRTNGWTVNYFLKDRIGPVDSQPYSLMIGKFRRGVPPGETADQTLAFHSEYLSVSCEEVLKESFSAAEETHSTQVQSAARKFSIGAREAMEPARVTEAELMHVHLNWDSEDGTGSMFAPIVRGMPFITMEYDNLTPIIPVTGDNIWAVNGTQVWALAPTQPQGIPIAESDEFVFQTFRFEKVPAGVTPTKINVLTWHMYFDEPVAWTAWSANFTDNANYKSGAEEEFDTVAGMVADRKISGTMRMALAKVETFEGLPAGTMGPPNINDAVPDNWDGPGSSVQFEIPKATLDQYVGAIPMRATIDATVDGTTSQLNYHFETQGEGPLAMYALPHHQHLLAADTQYDQSFMFPGPRRETRDERRFWAFGDLRAVIGDQWTLEYETINPGFQAAKEIDPAYRADIIAALRIEKDLPPVIADSLDQVQTYTSGKGMNHLARMILIADQLNEQQADPELVTIRDGLLSQLKSTLSRWLDGTTFLGTVTGQVGDEQRLLYDEDWGGINNQWGLDKNTVTQTETVLLDFGQSMYNDNHFHFGYFIYAAAVVEKYEPGYLDTQMANGLGTYRDAIYTLIRSIANPSAEDPYFPVLRHWDPWWGHSFANGLVPLDGDLGMRNQESVSEAIHAWYGVQLLGQVDGNEMLEALGTLLLSSESVASQFYWQRPGTKTPMDSDGYSGPILHDGYLFLASSNKWSIHTAAPTFFGAHPEYVYGIITLPFTPATEHHVKAYWTDEAQAQIESRIDGTFPTALPFHMPEFDESWRWSMLSMLAVSDGAEVASRLAANPLPVPNAKDDTTITNALWWIATR